MSAVTVKYKFRGTFDQKIDAKGRLSVPSHFRTVAEKGDPDFSPYRSKEEPGTFARITLVYGEQGMPYFEGYSVEGMARIDSLIEQMPIGDAEGRRERAEEIYYSNAHELQIDADGRIIIPQFLRERLALDGEVSFVAKGDYFQFWNPATRAGLHGDKTAARSEDYAKGFSPQSLFAGSSGGAG